MSKDLLETEMFGPRLQDHARIKIAKDTWPYLGGGRKKGVDVFRDGPVRYYLCTLPDEKSGSPFRYALRPANRYMRAPVRNVDVICRLYSAQEVLDLVEKGVFKKAAASIVMEDLL